MKKTNLEFELLKLIRESRKNSRIHSNDSIDFTMENDKTADIRDSMLQFERAFRGVGKNLKLENPANVHCRYYAQEMNYRVCLLMEKLIGSLHLLTPTARDLVVDLPPLSEDQAKCLTLTGPLGNGWKIARKYNDKFGANGTWAKIEVSYGGPIMISTTNGVATRKKQIDIPKYSSEISNIELFKKIGADEKFLDSTISSYLKDQNNWPSDVDNNAEEIRRAKNMFAQCIRQFGTSDVELMLKHINVCKTVLSDEKRTRKLF